MDQCHALWCVFVAELLCQGQNIIVFSLALRCSRWHYIGGIGARPQIENAVMTRPIRRASEFFIGVVQELSNPIALVDVFGCDG